LAHDFGINGAPTGGDAPHGNDEFVDIDHPILE
jgi:hypothetical protein